MDGLSIRNSGTGMTGQGVTEVRGERMESPRANLGTADKAGSSFADTLKDAVNSVNQLQKSSDKEMQLLATGKNNNLHETMIAAEKADIALRLMVQVRNKIIDAYHEVMKMQV